MISYLKLNLNKKFHIIREIIIYCAYKNSFVLGIKYMRNIT